MASIQHASTQAAIIASELATSVRGCLLGASAWAAQIVPSVLMWIHKPMTK
jgi:hypothetical protein